MRPLLAATIDPQVPDLSFLRYPVLASFKYDGWRALNAEEPMSRYWKPLPNAHVSDYMSSFVPYGLDGELMVRNPAKLEDEHGWLPFNNTEQYGRGINSWLSTELGEPDFCYMVFDCWKLGVQDLPYTQRLAITQAKVAHCNPDRVRFVEQRVLTSELEVLNFESLALSLGYEGIILRSPRAPYKCGRSTLNEQTLLKLKRFSDCEATVLSFEELYSNTNLATLDARGYTHRSAHADNLIPQNTLGALVVHSPLFSEPFRIGTGFTAAERQLIWNNREHFYGKLLTFKYQPHGTTTKPRSPVFKCFRVA